MFEKVNPFHPDKVADRIAGALVDYAYSVEDNPRIAVEVLLGHGVCTIIAESSVNIPFSKAWETVVRITRVHEWGKFTFHCVKQDAILAGNQARGIRCGDNGIFKGSPVTEEQRRLTEIAADICTDNPTDGKYIIDRLGVDDTRLIICQSQADADVLAHRYPGAVINPLGPWDGGTDVDSGATNRKLGSDMGEGVTGGGLHGKDLSKADVSVNIWAHLRAQEWNVPVRVSCAIGDDTVAGEPYADIVETARRYIRKIGGFERFAEWGLIRPLR